MKKLKIKETKDKKVIKIQIVEQTHRCEKFGKDNEIFTHNGFFLSSCGMPQSINNALYVRGSQEEFDNYIVNARGPDWIKKMRAAVEAYNEYFSNCDICEDRKCNSCPKNKEE